MPTFLLILPQKEALVVYIHRTRSEKQRHLNKSINLTFIRSEPAVPWSDETVPERRKRIK